MSEQKVSNKKNQILSWIIFLPTLIIVLVTLILGMFPALIITFSDKVRFPVEINAFEPGIWMFPILISNTIIFATIILYQKNKLPQLLTNLFRDILNFEISHRTALVLVGVLIGLYAISTIEELPTGDPWEDFIALEVILRNFSYDDLVFHFKLTPFLFGYLSMEILAIIESFHLLQV